MASTNGMASITPQERLQQRLNEPETALLLLEVLDRLDVMALTLTSLDSFLRRGDEIIENVSESIQEVQQAIPETDLDVPGTTQTLAEHLPTLIDALPELTASLPRLLELNRRLGEPATFEAINQVLDRIDLVAASLEMVDSFLRRGDEVADNVAESVREALDTAPADKVAMLAPLAETLPQLLQILPAFARMLPQLMEVTERLQSLLESEEFAALMGSGVFAPRTVGIVAEVGEALVEGYEATRQQPDPPSLWKLVRSLRDPEVRRALAFLVEFGGRLGQAVAPPER